VEGDDMITREIAVKVRDTVDAGLVKGVGKPVPGQMCVEAAVCYALGLPHGDDPGCVLAPLRRLTIRLSDSSWSSNEARAQGLRRLALAQLGSKGVLDDREFVHRLAEMTIRTVVPVALRSAAKLDPRHRAPLLAAAERCEREGTRESAQAARFAAEAAYADAYAAASAAAYAAAYAASDADAYAAADAAAADARTRDRVLADYAESVVQILIAMQAPGCQWLDLAPEQSYLRDPVSR
jgi:hypothetical protein